MNPEQSNILNYETLKSNLDRGEISSLYFFYGPEAYLIDSALDAVRKVSVEPGAEEFNWSTFRADADTIDWSAFADCLSSLALIPTRRGVVLKGLNKALRNKSVVQLIENTVKGSDPDLVLVLVEQDPDLKKSFYRFLLKECTCVHFPPPDANTIQKYLSEYAGTFGKEISEAAFEKILTETDPDLRSLLQKLEVLIFYLGDEKVITPQAVEACTAFTKEVGIFNLLQALGRRDTAGCYEIIEQLSKNRVDVSSFFVLLYRQLWAMYRMKYLQDQRVPNWKWHEWIEIKPKFLENRYKQYLAHYTREQLGYALEALAETDNLRKTTTVQDDLLLRTLTSKILHYEG
jgi:DNA polymerase-3 subunit delta